MGNMIFSSDVDSQMALQIIPPHGKTGEEFDDASLADDESRPQPRPPRRHPEERSDEGSQPVMSGVATTSRAERLHAADRCFFRSAVGAAEVSPARKGWEKKIAFRQISFRAFSARAFLIPGTQPSTGRRPTSTPGLVRERNETAVVGGTVLNRGRNS
jgi:hypothetical protein